jgi:hypothetical protein
MYRIRETSEPGAGHRVSTGNPRDGFALAAAILAMVLIGALVTAGFIAASQENRMGQSTRVANEAFYIAQAGLDSVVGSWRTAEYTAVPATGLTVGPVSVGAGGRVFGSYTGEVRPLGGRLFLISSTGTTANQGRFSGAERALALLVRTRTMDMHMDRALQVNGNLSVGGNSLVNGNDRVPGGWGGLDCEDRGQVNAIVADDDSNIEVFGSGEISGPTERTTLTTEDFTVFGDVTYQDLVDMARAGGKSFPHGANVHPQPVVTDGRCVTTVMSNWGDPRSQASACFSYFPVIHAAGDLHLPSQSVGQGILLVDGDLHVTGRMQFFGIVIVRGNLQSTGTGGHLNGVTLVGGQSLIELNPNDESHALGNSLVQYSSCAIERAIRENDQISRGVPVFARSWVDLSAAGGQ